MKSSGLASLLMSDVSATASVTLVDDENEAEAWSGPDFVEKVVTARYPWVATSEKVGIGELVVA